MTQKNKESLLRESTVFQQILQEGRVEGKLAMIYRLLPRLFFKSGDRCHEIGGPT